jgi:hypothetical protein
MPFVMDERIGIEIPNLSIPFEQLPRAQQEEMLVKWEGIRSGIPDQIMKFERLIENLLEKVHHEEDWDVVAAHFEIISDYASRIAELNAWRRVDPSMPSGTRALAKEHHDREK